MPRLTLRDFRYSRGPRVIGLCAENVPGCAEYVNGAQRRLILCREAGDEGWWGTWAEVSFNNVSRDNPYLTCPREIARLEAINVCSYPVKLHNQFYEYLNFGNGRLPKTCRTSSRWFCDTQALTRNSVITFSEPNISPFLIRIYPTDIVDSEASRQVLIQGLDSSGEQIFTQNFTKQIMGELVAMETPFADTTMQFSRITGIQKDVTNGIIQIFQLDPTTGDERLLLIMQPGEQVAGYRRYYLNNLPQNCCLVPGLTNSNLTITAIAKMEMIPVVVDTDYLLLHNLEAVIEECIAIRMSEMDNLEAQQLAAVHHLNAVRLLNAEIAHYLGKQSPAVSFAPFGTARLECQRIGLLT